MPNDLRATSLDARDKDDKLERLIAAMQCKFCASDSTIAKGDIDSFVASLNSVDNISYEDTGGLPAS